MNHLRISANSRHIAWVLVTLVAVGACGEGFTEPDCEDSRTCDGGAAGSAGEAAGSGGQQADAGSPAQEKGGQQASGGDADGGTSGQAGRAGNSGEGGFSGAVPGAGQAGLVQGGEAGAVEAGGAGASGQAGAETMAGNAGDAGAAGTSDLQTAGVAGGAGAQPAGGSSSAGESGEGGVVATGGSSVAGSGTAGSADAGSAGVGEGGGPSVEIPQLELVTDALAPVLLNTMVDLRLQTAGGMGRRQIAALSGIPEGLSLAADGHLSGRPRVPGIHEIELQVTDALGQRLVTRRILRVDRTSHLALRGKDPITEGENLWLRELADAEAYSLALDDSPNSTVNVVASAWAVGGDAIAWVVDTNSDGRFEVHAARLDGAEPSVRVLEPAPSPSSPSAGGTVLSWSFDGQSLAYSTQASQGEFPFSLRLVEYEQGEPRSPTTLTTNDLDFPLSPLGWASDRLLTVAAGTAVQFQRGTDGALGASEVVPGTTFSTPYSAVQTSDPSSPWVTFRVTGNHGGYLYDYLFNLDAGQVQQEGSDPTVSLRSGRVCRLEEDPSTQEATLGIYDVAALQTGAPRMRVVGTRRTLAGNDRRAIYWSEDAQWLAFDPSTAGPLMVAPVGGEGTIAAWSVPGSYQPVASGGVASQARFSADNRWLVFRDGDHLWAAPLSQSSVGEARRISTELPNPSTDSIQSFLVSPDGRFVAFVGSMRTAGVPELFLASLEGDSPGEPIPLEVPHASSEKLQWSQDSSYLACDTQAYEDEQGVVSAGTWLFDGLGSSAVAERLDCANRPCSERHLAGFRPWMGR